MKVRQLGLALAACVLCLLSACRTAKAEPKAGDEFVKPASKNDAAPLKAEVESGEALVMPFAGAGEDEAKPDFKSGDPRIKLKWRTESEADCFGYYVYRADKVDGDYVGLNLKKPLVGAGTTSIPHIYVYYDLDLKMGVRYFYKIKQIDLDGSEHWVKGEKEGVPAEPKALGKEELDEIRANGAHYSTAVSE